MVVDTTTLIFCAVGCSVDCCPVNSTISPKSTVVPSPPTALSPVTLSSFEGVSSVTDWVECCVVAACVEGSSVAI